MVALLQPYVAMCGVKYEHTPLGLQRLGMKRGYMEEKVEIDQSGLYERIEVPEFDECKRAVVLHEFVKVNNSKTPLKFPEIIVLFLF